jgi:hypothetical protein
MDNLTCGLIVGLLIIGLTSWLFKYLKGKNHRNLGHYVCSRCGAVSAHTQRTKTAETIGKKSFCSKCHREWLQRTGRLNNNGTEYSRNNKGCLFVVVIFSSMLTSSLIFIIKKTMGT